MAGYKNYRKHAADILRAVGGKIGKPKHSNVKINLLGGISRKGLAPLVLFKGIMWSPDFQHYMSLSVMLSFEKNFLIDIDCSWTTIRNIQVDPLKTIYSQMVSTMLKHPLNLQLVLKRFICLNQFWDKMVKAHGQFLVITFKQSSVFYQNSVSAKSH